MSKGAGCDADAPSSLARLAQVADPRLGQAAPGELAAACGSGSLAISGVDNATSKPCCWSMVSESARPEAERSCELEDAWFRDAACTRLTNLVLLVSSLV